MLHEINIEQTTVSTYNKKIHNNTYDFKVILIFTCILLPNIQDDIYEDCYVYESDVCVFMCIHFWFCICVHILHPEVDFSCLPILLSILFEREFLKIPCINLNC